MSTTVLEINDLSKKYGKVRALNKLNLQVQQGTVFGILGPNGSGKTTTLGILLGVLNATSGKFSWFGNGHKNENRFRIGALLETPNFYPYLSAVRNLRIVGKIKGIDNVDVRIEKVLEIVNLLERKDSKFKTYSLGMKQRLAIASALLNDPEVLVLDEPTNGLDPQGIAEIRNLIVDIASKGKTIIIASHQLDEIEKVCTDVVILKKGIAIRQSGIENIIEHARQIILACDDNQKLSLALEAMKGVSIEKKEGKTITLGVTDNVTTKDVNKFCFEKGIVLTELKEVRKSLEDQFLEITKE